MTNGVSNKQAAKLSKQVAITTERAAAAAAKVASGPPPEPAPTLATQALFASPVGDRGTAADTEPVQRAVPPGAQRLAQFTGVTRRVPVRGALPRRKREFERDVLASGPVDAVPTRRATPLRRK